jgi:hypothetical protein
MADDDLAEEDELAEDDELEEEDELEEGGELNEDDSFSPASVGLLKNEANFFFCRFPAGFST